VMLMTTMKDAGMQKGAKRKKSKVKLYKSVMCTMPAWAQGQTQN